MSWIAVLTAAWLLPVGLADAQDRPTGSGSDREQDENAPAVERQGEGQGRHRKGPHSRPFAGGPGMGLGRHLFDVMPEDQGPLRPGEEEQLLAFAQEHMPRFYELMQSLRQRNPERCRAKLSDNAPRLRHLRRVYERNPRIGAIIQEHAENLLRVRHDLRAVRSEPPDSSLYATAVQAARGRVADNVRLEIEVLQALAAELDQQRDERVEQRTAYLVGDGADLADAPPKLRELIAAFHAATGQTERDEAQKLVKEAAAQQLEAELKGLQQRIQNMQDNAAGEVDQRMERLLAGLKDDANEPAGRRPHPDRGP